MNLRTEIKQLWDAISRQYKRGHYANAIEGALFFLRDLVRDCANLDADGASLAGLALRGNPPRLRINKFEE